MASYDNKIFNADVFGAYVDTVPNLTRTELIKSGAVRLRNDIKALFPEQTGGHFATIPMKGNISGTPVKYDGSTDITASSRLTFSQGIKVIGRAKAFDENDFSTDITGGVDFMATASEVATYWDEQTQEQLLAILQGIFAMSGTGNADFVNNHTLNISLDATPANRVVGAGTLNSAIQKACGDNKGKFSVVIMHSAVATNLENLQLLNYLKYTDASGVQRDLSLATWNGKLVLIDDGMPSSVEVITAEVKGTYTLTLSDAFAAGESFVLNGETYAWVASDPTGNQFTGATVAAQGASLAPLLQTNNAPFTVAFATATFTFTQRVGGTGGIPTVTDTDSNLGDPTAVATGVAEVSQTVYTTYALGAGAIDYADVGVKVPYEMDRDPATNGGVDTLYTRKRQILAPFGISYLDSTTICPSDDDLKNGAKWALVKDSSDTYFISHRSIPIARIISVG